MYDILVLNHTLRPDGAKLRPIIWILAEYFHREGLSVHVHYGLQNPPKARVVLNHIDLTNTPPEYVRLLQKYPLVLNERLTNISKRFVCQGTLLGRGDGYRSSVIVKTDLNAGGGPELAQLRAQGKLPKGQSIRVPLRDTPFLNPESYFIYDSADAVPAEVWENPNLVVQRFFPERNEEGHYCLRSWFVLGDRGFHIMTTASSPIVKLSTLISRKVLEVPTPPRLEARRRELGMDFGRFDYTLHDGDAVIFDANRTPFISTGGENYYQACWPELALGIRRYLAGDGRPT